MWRLPLAISRIVSRNRNLCEAAFRVGGPKARLKREPLMTSSYSINCDKNFLSSLGRGYAGHPRIRSWYYGITENAKEYSWHTTAKALKAGKTNLATHKLSDSTLASPPTFLLLQLLFEALWQQSTYTLQLLLVPVADLGSNVRGGDFHDIWLLSLTTPSLL